MIIIIIIIIIRTYLKTKGSLPLGIFLTPLTVKFPSYNVLPCLTPDLNIVYRI